MNVEVFVLIMGVSAKKIKRAGKEMYGRVNE